jgi:hypothetical protein
VAKFTFTVDLDENDKLRLLQNSIERVMNNAIWVGGEAQNELKGDASERGSTLWQDCEELKPLTCKIWGAAQEAVRRGPQSNEA